MKNIYTLGVALCLLTACSSEQESESPNVEQNTSEEQNTNVQYDNIHLADVLGGEYHSVYIYEYKNGEQIGEQIALFGEDLEQLLKVLKETTLIREPLPDDTPMSEVSYSVDVRGNVDTTTMFVYEENGEQRVSLLANDVIPSGLRKATNTDILKSIEAIKASEE